MVAVKIFSFSKDVGIKFKHHKRKCANRLKD